MNFHWAVTYLYFLPQLCINFSKQSHFLSGFFTLQLLPTIETFHHDVDDLDTKHDIADLDRELLFADTHTPIQLLYLGH